MTELATIPWEGVRRVLADWSGRGELLDALSQEDEFARDWDRRDLELRADWLSYRRLRGRIGRLPTRRSEWLRALPAATKSMRNVSESPRGHTEWVETRVRFGWPPERFVVDQRQKTRARLLLQLATWSAAAVDQLVGAAGRVEGTVSEVTQRVSHALLGAFPDKPLSRVTREHIDAGASAGPPWNILSAIATDLRPNLEELARGLATPNEDLQGRLFHIGVLGTILSALERSGRRVKSVRPLTQPSTPGPAYLALGSPDVEVWYEASSIWSVHDEASHYDRLKASLELQASPMSPDIVVIADSTAVAIECKYSLRPQYAVRSGYYQAFTYAMELAPIFHRTVGVVAAPTELLEHGWAEERVTAMTKVAAGSPSTLGRKLLRLLDMPDVSKATPFLSVAAEAHGDDLETSGHKQVYWADRAPVVDIDENG